MNSRHPVQTTGITPSGGKGASARDWLQFNDTCFTANWVTKLNQATGGGCYGVQEVPPGQDFVR